MRPRATLLTFLELSGQETEKHTNSRIHSVPHRDECYGKEKDAAKTDREPWRRSGQSFQTSEQASLLKETWGGEEWTLHTLFLRELPSREKEQQCRCPGVDPGGHRGWC